MKVAFTLLRLMIALVFAFALVNPVYAGEKEKEFEIEKMEMEKVEKVEKVEKMEPLKNKSEARERVFADDDFFFVDDDLFFPQRRFFFGAPKFFGPKFFGPRFFDD